MTTVPQTAITNGTPVRSGTAGTVYSHVLVVGMLREWRLVISPTTNLPTLFGTGTMRRLWLAQPPQRVVVELMPAPLPERYGAPRPPPPRLIRLEGRVVEFTRNSIVIAEGAYVHDERRAAGRAGEPA